MADDKAGPGREHDEYRHHDQYDPHHGRGDEINRTDKEYGEEQVDQVDQRRPGDGIAHDLQIAEKALPVGRAAPLEAAQGQVEQLAEKGSAQVDVDPDRGRLHHPAARLTEQKIEGDGHHHAQDQAVKRGYALVENHPVVDLQHEDRGRQGQHVDETGGHDEP